jgi:predicted N-acetyltransferase YhbS
MMVIRHATDGERSGVLDVHLRAFGPVQGREIVGLVDRLFDDETAEPLLSLVVEEEGRLVGHVLFTRAALEHDGADVAMRILAPLAVAPEFQGKGIGSALIREGLGQLESRGVELVFVLGHPGYYPRFGFRPAGEFGFEAPYEIPLEHADAWMVRALTAGVVGHTRGRIHCAKTLDESRYWLE